LHLLPSLSCIFILIPRAHADLIVFDLVKITSYGFGFVCTGRTNSLSLIRFVQCRLVDTVVWTMSQ
jgi:hypothetical protein